MDYELQASEKAQLFTSTLAELRSDHSVINYGAIIICRRGTATMRIDFKCWRLEVGAVITLFPNDVTQITDASPDFLVEMLRYSPALLREASLQLEQTVYSVLRKDRCRGSQPVVSDIVNGVFHLLHIYFDQPECQCTNQLVLYQLKAFFVGFYDWITRNQQANADDNTSWRVNELFNQFMQLLESDFRLSHDVGYYADRLCISSKYLNTITKRITNHTPKTIIDHYVILQLKLLLRQSNLSIKQIAWDFHFSDSSFFCRYFKQHTGLTPQAFRRESETLN